MSDVTFPASDGDLRGWLATPAGAGPWPGVVVLHESFGLNDDIRAHADRLAREGYLTLAPDLFSWGLTAVCLVQAMRAVSTGRGRAYADIDAARRWLAADERCTGRIGVIGFCMGGGFAVACAPRFEFAAAAANYGHVPKDAGTSLAGACPIVGSYGGRDRMLRGHADRLERALTALGVEHDVKEYPEASHSFLNRHSGVAGLLGRVTGVGFEQSAADDAWRRILAFFRTHLAERGS